MSNDISIIIADAHFLARKGLRGVINEQAGFCVIGEVGNEPSLLSKVEELKPDIVILDYDQPDHFSTETVNRVKKSSPFTGVLVISSDSDRSNIYDVLENGINSYITKHCDEKEIVDAIRATARKEKFFCHKILETILDKSFGKEEEACEPTPLTPREVEIVQLIATGRIAKEIADELHLSTHTIYTHRKNIMRKLDISSPVELVMYAINKGLVDPKQEKN